MTNGAVVQTGAVVAGHVPVWSGNGQVQDGGTPASGVISGIGIQNNGALALGINSGPITGPFVQYGVSVSSTGAITISMGGYGGAPAATLSYIINGTTYAFNPAGAGNITGPNTTTVGDLVAWNGSAGTLVKDSAIALTSLSPSVASVAALRAATATTLPTNQCFVVGYYAGSDGGGGFYWYNSTESVSADNGGSIIVDASNRRWYLDNFSRPYSVRQFGAKGDGVTNDQAAIQNCINAVQAMGGGIVYFPSAPSGYPAAAPGFPAANYLVATGTLAVTAGGVYLQGPGKLGGVSITFTNGAADCITAIGPSFAGSIYGFGVSGLTLVSQGKTGGRLMAIAYVNHFVLRDIYATCWTGIELWVNNTGWIENVQIVAVTGGALIPASHYGSYAPGACYGIWWHAPGDNSARSDILYTNGILIQAANSGAYGIIWDGLANTWNSNNDAVLGAAYGLLVLNSAVSTSWYPIFGQFSNFTTEGITKQAVRIQGGSQFYFVNSLINNNTGQYGNSDTNALYIAADVSGSSTNDIKLTNCRIGGSFQTAAYIAARDVQISNCLFTGGLGMAANTWPALEIAAPAQDIVVVGCKYNVWAQPTTWKYGVQVDNGSFRVLVDGNLLYNAATRAIAWNNYDNSSAAFDNITTPNPSMPDPAGISVANGGTIPAANMVGAALNLSTSAGGNWAAFVDTAANIVAAYPNPKIFSAIPLLVINSSPYQVTIQSATGVSFVGNTSGGNFVMAANTQRQFMIQMQNPTIGAESAFLYG